MNKGSRYHIISSLAIDLGGKNTGVLFTHGEVSKSPDKHERKGITMIFPDKGLNLSQQARLAKRHQRRGFKRRRLAKRLLQLLLQQKYKGTKEDFLTDFQKLRTFLNRRGYTYLTMEEIEGVVEEIQSCDFDTRLAIIDALGQGCELDARLNLLPQLEKTDQKPLDFFRKLSALSLKATVKNSQIDKNLAKIIRKIGEYCNKVLKAEEEGHKTRGEYLTHMRQDLQSEEFQQIARKSSLTTNQLANMIGHISNLQLRVLRRYFNDPQMAQADYWDESRLQKIFLRYMRAWHVKPTDREYKNRSQIYDFIARDGILKTFLNTDPTLSIPPFEDMNNRRPPTCKSLHLDQSKLDKDYPNWRQWVRELVKATENTYELENFDQNSELQTITGYYDKSRIAISHKKSKGMEAILLQRIFDRTSDIDRYRFRLQVAVDNMIASEEIPDESIQRKYESSKAELTRVLGEKDSKQILTLAEQYYREMENAKRGLWLPEETGNLLFRCDRKPKQKKNLREELIGHILMTDLTDKDRWISWEKIYTEPKKINNRSSISSICRNIETTRKNMGDEFIFYWNIIKRPGYQPNANDKTEKEVLKQKENAEKAATVIADFLGHDELARQKYANPYSLAQIYNIMEGDISGFYRTCPACTRENFWRTSPAAVAPADRNGGPVARASRLSADTMRPFDGFLARYLERIGEKIALLKWQQLNDCTSNQQILIPILLEENRFQFTSDLAEIKNSTKKKEAKDRLARSQKRFEDKWERIRKANKNICPYTGEAIDHGGEYDHILPRSYSKGRFGTIFNHEMNLIYASSQGNRLKGDKFYSLKDLHSRYLRKLFGTTDIEAIRNTIKATVNKFDKERSVYFHNLTEQEQRDFRHALFVKDFHKKLHGLLHSHYKMRVSGLQGYLARIIYENLQKLNENKKLPLHFKVFSYSAEDDMLASRRKNLEAYNKLYIKPRESGQAPGSHVIDATMVWAHALDREDIPGLSKGLLLEEQALEELLPDNLQIISLAAREKYRRKKPQSMQIFKDTIYAERYLSLIINKKACGFGYDLKNMAEFDYEQLSFVFELLKPFVAYKGAEITDSLENYMKELGAKKKFIYFNIVREKAADFLQTKCFAPEISELEKNQQTLLTGLRYFTLKNNIFSTLSDNQDKVKLLTDDDKQNFSRTISIVLQPHNNKKKFSIKGNILLPHLAAWETLASDKMIKKLVGKGAKWSELEGPQTSELLERHFPPTITNPLKHHGVRKVYSLPMPEGPSGGFRIQRRRKEGRQFHVQAIEGAKFSGFVANEGIVDFNNPVIMSLLARENSLAPTDGYVGRAPKDIIYMDEWREIPLKDFPKEWKTVNKFWLQPNSESRMRVRLELHNALLGETSTTMHLTIPLAFATAQTTDEKNLTRIEKIIPDLLKKLGLKPRDKVNLVMANHNSTTYEFVVQSTNVQMKGWYNLGKPCDI